MKAVAIIPARGGSKGIPRKNLVPLCGKPLIAWSIEAAQKSRLVKTIIVSTDDDEIADVAEKYGADKIVLRPPEMATDEAPTDPVLIHALAVTRAKEEFTVLLQPTSPIRPRDLIDKCILQMIGSMANSLFTGCYGHHFVWQRAQGWNGDPLKRKGLMRPLSFNIYGRKRRQDMSEYELPFYENGSVYVVKSDLLIKNGNRIVDPVQGFEMPEVYSIDINHDYELAHAEIIMKQINPESENVCQRQKGLDIPHQPD